MQSNVRSGAQDKRKSASKQWIGYDSNVAEVDGSLHVFSDAAMSEEEEDDGPRRVQEKHVLLDHVPQVTPMFKLPRTPVCHVPPGCRPMSHQRVQWQGLAFLQERPKSALPGPSDTISAHALCGDACKACQHLGLSLDRRWKPSCNPQHHFWISNPNHTSFKSTLNSYILKDIKLP